MAPRDDTLEDGQVLAQLTSISELHPGAVLRLWRESLSRWAPGWWCEVMRVEGSVVQVRDLKSGQMASHAVTDLLGSAWTHPTPQALKGSETGPVWIDLREATSQRGDGDARESTKNTRIALGLGADSRVELQHSLLVGINALADAVKATLGPKGRKVAIHVGSTGPIFAQDSLAVCERVVLKNPVENMAVCILRDAGRAMRRECGDGSATAIVMAQAMYGSAVAQLTSGTDTELIEKSIDVAVQAVDTALKRVARRIENSEIARVAAMAGRGEELVGQIVATAMDKVGKDGAIVVERSAVVDTSLDVVEGMEFDRGYLSGEFITDIERKECVLDNPALLLVDGKIERSEEALRLANEAHGVGRSMLMLGDDVSTQVAQVLVDAARRTGLRLCVVRAPGFGERRKAYLEDLAILSGGCVRKTSELAGASLDQLGGARRAIVTKGTTTIIECKGEEAAIVGRVKKLRVDIEECTSEYDREKLMERLAKLVGGVAVINVGGDGEEDAKGRLSRVESGLRAATAAVQEGVAVGGGLTLLRVLHSLEASGELAAAIESVRLACEAPIRQLIVNAGEDDNRVLSTISPNQKGVGFNAATGHCEDLVAAGVVDPVKVIRFALQTAKTVTLNLLNTCAAVVTSE